MKFILLHETKLVTRHN